MKGCNQFLQYSWEIRNFFSHYFWDISILKLGIVNNILFWVSVYNSNSWPIHNRWRGSKLHIPITCRSVFVGLFWFSTLLFPHIFELLFPLWSLFCLLRSCIRSLFFWLRLTLSRLISIRSLSHLILILSRFGTFFNFFFNIIIFKIFHKLFNFFWCHLIKKTI